MLDQETGARGYLITGRDASLEPYRAGRRALDEAITKLKLLIAGSPAEVKSLADAEEAAREWQNNIGEKIARGGGDPVARAEFPFD